jgi:hypothetical protein
MTRTHSPATRRLLTIYLQDHYAGATAGLALFRRAASSHSDATIRAEIGRLAAEVAQDRSALRQIMGSLGIRPARTKALLAWVGEKVGRLKGNGRLFSRSPLSDLVELEGLIMGVTGKARVWESLQQAAERDHRLPESRIQGLVKGAEDQRARLEQLHRACALATFG